MRSLGAKGLALAVVLLGAAPPLPHLGAPTVAAHVGGTVTRPRIENDEPMVPAPAAPSVSPFLEKLGSGDFVEFPAGRTTVLLPARFVNETIVVKVTIAGQDYDFAIDSGASSIVIDHELAGALGLRTVEKPRRSSSGAFERAQVVIPSIDVAGLHMHDVIANSLPFHYKVPGEAHVVGLLGFDFIAGVVLHVDYAAQRVEAIAPSAFREPPGEAYVVPLDLTDGIPVAAAIVGEEVGKHFVVDTGAGGVVLFSSFVRQHFPGAVAEMSAATETGGPPFLEASGVGGTISMQSAHIERFSFGSVRFSDFTAYVARDTPGIADSRLDGVIGADALKYFELYFDYRERRLVLVPGTFLHANAEKLLPSRPAAQ